MSDKPTGVFVRLPNGATDPQWAKAYDAVVGDENTKKASLWDFIQIAKAIGTPVTGGDIPVITTLGTLRDPIPLIRQSDAQAQIAALEAEVVRLREALEESRNAIMSDLNTHSIVCTVWAAPAETLVDYIDAALKGGAA